MSRDAELTAALVEAARRAFTQVRAEHPAEVFYCFALFTSADVGYIEPTCSGEQGLREVAQDYVQADDGTLATQLAELRWSPVDSPYHCDLAFSPSGAVLASAHAGGDIHVWEADSGEHRLRLRGRQESMLAVVFIDERRLAAAGQDVDCGPPVYIWDL